MRAARVGGVGLQIVRDRVVRFNARGPDGLLDGKAPGARSRLDDVQRRALVETVERGPIPAIQGVVRWRLCDLVRWLHQAFAVLPDETTAGREPERLGHVKQTARPRHHAQNELALEAFKKGALPPRWQRSDEHVGGHAQARRPAPAHHDHRTPPTDAWVMINASWYKAAGSPGVNTDMPDGVLNPWSKRPFPGVPDSFPPHAACGGGAIAIPGRRPAAAPPLEGSN